MRRSRGSRFLALVFAIGLLAVACGDDAADTTTTTRAPGQTGAGATTTTGGAPKAGGTFRLAIGEPAAIDPARARESEGINVTRVLFDGLVTIDDKTAEVKPALAEKWTANADCTEWTFNIKKGTKFSNGEEVTAQSFIVGWTRAVDDKTASQVASHMSDIVGYEELHGSGSEEEGDLVAGTTETFSGVSATDPNTLVVKLTAADCEFHKKTLHSVFSPVPKDAGAGDNQTYNEAPIGNGPFMLKPGTKWNRDQSISLVRNDTYHGTKPSLEALEYTIFPAQGRLAAEYRAFQAGDLDYSRIPPELLAQAIAENQAKGGLVKGEMAGINYFVPNASRAPLNNADARRAISLAIDRVAINQGVYQGVLTPAAAFIPPPFANTHQHGVCDSCKHDEAAAKAAAERGGLTAGTSIRLLYNNDGGHEALVQAWKDQLERTLGLTVELVGVPFAESLAMQDEGNFDIARSGWGADYPSPDNFLYPQMGSDSGDNVGKYSNPAFDNLITQARAAKTEDERVRLWREAEKLAIGQDVALFPLYYRTQYRVFNAEKWSGVGMNYFENPTLIGITAK